ncbi:hypothetical protein AS25_01450 [Kocuria marina]|uniref:Uncharacterized protein n=1 Tax=Kocuria marina TaxID=223184 RepID=A0A0B0DC04_9MICC|nr:hypothetical protein AS25_01450 [Kocuria marina]
MEHAEIFQCDSRAASAGKRIIDYCPSPGAEKGLYFGKLFNQGIDFGGLVVEVVRDLLLLRHGWYRESSCTKLLLIEDGSTINITRCCSFVG